METTTDGRERPIIMSAEEVRAILEGRKSQTRRVIKPQPVRRVIESEEKAANGLPRYTSIGWYIGDESLSEIGKEEFLRRCPYGAPGDRLWVKEAWAVHEAWDDIPPSQIIRSAPRYYPATDTWQDEEDMRRYIGRNRSPIYMPRRYCRLVLDLVDVRVERVQEIRTDDAVEEGVGVIGYRKRFGTKPEGSAIDRFRELWDSINAKRGYPWEDNPFVWVLEFRRVA